MHAFIDVLVGSTGSVVQLAPVTRVSKCAYSIALGVVLDDVYTLYSDNTM